MTTAEVDIQQTTSETNSTIISSAPGVSFTSTFVMGTDTGLLVALIGKAPEDAQRYMLRPSSSQLTP